MATVPSVTSSGQLSKVDQLPIGSRTQKRFVLLDSRMCARVGVLLSCFYFLLCQGGGGKGSQLCPKFIRCLEPQGKLGYKCLDK